MIIVIILFSLLNPSAFAANKCAGIFAPKIHSQKLKSSVDASIKALAEFRIYLDLAKASGHGSLDRQVLEKNYGEKENDLADYLQQNKIMSREDFVEKIKTEISKIQKENANSQEKKLSEKEERQGKQQVIKLQNLYGTTGMFNMVKPGSFVMGQKLVSQVQVTISKSFEMLSTPTTQGVWESVALLANKELSLDQLIPPTPTTYKGLNRPVGGVSFPTVQNWLSALNELSQQGFSKELSKIFPGHKKGDRYRLPTEAEWEFVIRGRGQHTTLYHFGSEEKFLEKYAWFNENSNGTTQPVAEKLPLIVDGEYFYDMHGNVKEWVQDNYAPRLQGGIDPQGPPTTADSQKAVRGGSFQDKSYEMYIDTRQAVRPQDTHYGHGFRIVREARP